MRIWGKPVKVGDKLYCYRDDLQFDNGVRFYKGQWYTIAMITSDECISFERIIGQASIQFIKFTEYNANTFFCTENVLRRMKLKKLNENEAL